MNTLPRSQRRESPTVVAAVVALCCLLGACRGGGDGGQADAAPTAASTAAPLPTTIATTVPPPPPAKVVFADTVGPGSEGPEVAYVQQRLKDLRFDPGPVDGAFGPSVQRAVWAYQKLIGLSGDEVTGEVTPELWSRMQDPFPLRPQLAGEAGGGTHLEVYLPQQVMVLFQQDQPALITHVSTGNDEDWCEKGVCGVAVTPGGTFAFDRRVPGWRQAELGLLYNPVYFNGGIAVHGASDVPKFPASHGCVRIPMHIADYFPTLVSDGDEVFVFDGVKDPRDYGAQPPPPNTKDPDYVGPDVTFDDTEQSDNTSPGPAATAPDDSETSLPEITVKPDPEPEREPESPSSSAEAPTSETTADAGESPAATDAPTDG